MREGCGVRESQFFCVHGNIKEDDGDIVDEPTVGAVIEIKEGKRAVSVHEEIVLMGILMDEPVGGVILGQGLNMFKHGSIVLVSSNFRCGQILFDEVQAGFVPLEAPPSRDCGLIVDRERMHLPKQASVILVACG